MTCDVQDRRSECTEGGASLLVPRGASESITRWNAMCVIYKIKTLFCGDCCLQGWITATNMLGLIPSAAFSCPGSVYEQFFQCFFALNFFLSIDNPEMDVPAMYNVTEQQYCSLAGCEIFGAASSFGYFCVPPNSTSINLDNFGNFLIE